MKKKQIANGIMVAMILVIVAAGILGAGYIRGWFDTADGDDAVLCDIRGVIHMERNGLSYPVSGETVLRAGDQLSCNAGASATIRAGENTFVIGEKASLAIEDPAGELFTAELKSGEVFADCESKAVIRFAGKDTQFYQVTAHVSVRAGAQSVSVLRGQVGNASAGQVLNYVGNTESVGKLDIHSLNDFTIAQLRGYDGSAALCFSAEELDLLMAERQQALQELISSQTKPTNPNDPTPETQNPGTETTYPPEATTSSEATVPSAAEKPTDSPNTEKPTDPPDIGKPTDPPGTGKPTEPPTAPPETTPPTPGGGSCTITIRCDTILHNMADLEPGKAEFVPEDGVILYPVTVEFEAGETVFHVLRRVCEIAGIQLEYSWTPLYNSYYIEGIHHLYEFDCGNESGWMYKVNGWFPNYGCSSYTLKDGDVIVWAYTCRGLGTDVGAPEWTG